MWNNLAIMDPNNFVRVFSEAFAIALVGNDIFSFAIKAYYMKRGNIDDISEYQLTSPQHLLCSYLLNISTMCWIGACALLGRL